MQQTAGLGDGVGGREVGDLGPGEKGVSLKVGI